MNQNSENFELERALGFHVNRTAYLMSEAVAKRFKVLGYSLTAQDFGILFRLHKQDGLSQKQMTELMKRDKTTITRRLDALVKKGLIERKMDDEDRRRFCLHLTSAGDEAYASLAVVVSGFQQEVLVDASVEEKAITIKVLQQVSARIMNQSAGEV